MKTETRNIKIQVRITDSEKAMIQEMRNNDREFNISRLVRKAIKEEYKKQEEGVGEFQITKGEEENGN